MSDKHKVILQAGNAAVTAGDNEGLLKFCTEDTDWHFIGEQRLQGKQAVREWMEKTYTEPPIVSVENLISDGTFLVAQGVVTMKNAAGIPTPYSYCDVWEFREDLIVSLKAYVIEQR